VAVAHETLALAGVGEARDGERENLRLLVLITEKAPSSNPPARGPGYSFRSGSHMSLNDAICGAVRIRPVPSASSSGSSCGGVLVVLARPSPPSSESTPLVARIADAKQLRSPRNAMLIRFSEDSSLVRASTRRDEASAANQVSGVPRRASCRRSRFRYPFSGPIRLH